MGQFVVSTAGHVLVPDPVEEILTEADIDIEQLDSPDENELIAAAQGARGLIVDSNTAVTARVLSSAESVTVVGRAGIGVDKIDLEAARENDVVVTNVPAYCVDEVAMHAISLLFSSIRNICFYSNQTQAGGWQLREDIPTHRMKDRTLGLVGFGKIPSAIASKLSGFDFSIVSSDPHITESEMAKQGVTKVSFEELLTMADYISVHAPLNEATHNLFDADAFEQMQDHAILINTSRGGIVDEQALADALDNGELAGAGLDVMAEEPPVDSPLLSNDKVIVTPHVAWYSVESREELSRTVTRDVVRILHGNGHDVPPNRVIVESNGSSS